MAKIQTQNDFRISIVIGTFNRPTLLQNLLSQLIKVSDNLSIEVLVFDQSSEENYKTNSSHFPEKKNFSIFRLEKPNTCQYLNLGWQKAKSPIVLYLDDDVTITKDTIEAHLSNYINPTVRGVAGRVINDNEDVSKNPNVGKIFFYGAEITKNFSYENKTTVDFPYGCNMSFQRGVLEELEGFDEKLKPPIYAYNEIDLGVRISQKWPQSIIFEPGALVYHHQHKKGGTRSYEANEVQKTIDFNYGYFLSKNYTMQQNIVCLLRRLPFQILREPTKVKDIIQGYLHQKKYSYKYL